MRELANFQVDEHVASEQAVVEHQIDEEVLFVEGEPLLPGLEEETFPQFEQELFNVGNDGRFQIGLGVAGLFLDAKKLQNVGVFEQVLRLGDVLPFPRQVTYCLLVAAEGQPLIEAGVELAPEAPTWVSMRLRSSTEFTGTVCQSNTMLTSKLGVPSQLNCRGSNRASAVPNSGSNGGLFCTRPSTEPSRSAAA